MKLFIVCNYPGGINAVIPVAQKLSVIGHDISFVTSIDRRNYFRNICLPVIYINAKLSCQDVREMLIDYGVEITITGTTESYDQIVGRLEAIFISESNKVGINTISITDCWHKQKARFSLSESNQIDVLPNKICVINDKAKSLMINDGFSEDIIYVTGNPGWDKLVGVRKRIARKKHYHKAIVFVSQPISEDDYNDIGYTENEVLLDVLKLVNEDPLLLNAEVLIKMHPRECPTKYNNLIGNKFGVKVSIIDDSYDIYGLAQGAICSIGMFSMMLTEFFILGFNAISYQPVSNKGSVIEVGLLENCVTTFNKLSEKIHSNKAISDIKVGNSTDNIIDLILNEENQ